MLFEVALPPTHRCWLDGRPEADASLQAARDVTVLSEWEVGRGKMNVQFIANVENQDRARCGQNEAGGMISFVCRARKHVANAVADVVWRTGH
jgi:hypothetical protein